MAPLNLGLGHPFPAKWRPFPAQNDGFFYGKLKFLPNWRFGLQIEIQSKLGIFFYFLSIS